MRTEDIKNGLRVRIVREVDLFPLGRFEVGLTGTIEKLNTAAGDGDIVAHVRLDQVLPELTEWDNCLHLWGADVPECTAEDFEPA